MSPSNAANPSSACAALPRSDPAKELLILRDRGLVRLKEQLADPGPVEPFAQHPEHLSLRTLDVDLQDVDVHVAESAHHGR